MTDMQLIPPEKCAHRARLTPAGQRLYDLMARMMIRRGRSVTFPERYEGSVTDIFDALLHDQPFLFDLRREQVSTGRGADRTEVGWDYYLPDDQYAVHRDRIYRELRRLRASIPGGGKALRREWEIHNLMQRMPLRTEESGAHAWWNYTIAGPLLYGETVCEGASMLFYLLCLLEGVPCQVVTGASCGPHRKGGPHAWNMVRLGDQHVHVDVYWDMCLYDEELGVSYDYFNLPDCKLRADHVWDADRYPPAVTENYSWFVMKRCEVFALEGFRQLLERCGAEEGQIMARFRVMPTHEEIREAAGRSLTARCGGHIVWRVNEDQQIVQLAVTNA